MPTNPKNPKNLNHHGIEDIIIFQLFFLLLLESLTHTLLSLHSFLFYFLTNKQTNNEMKRDGVKKTRNIYAFYSAANF
jgi:hypothetical protein